MTENNWPDPWQVAALLNMIAFNTELLLSAAERALNTGENDMLDHVVTNLGDGLRRNLDTSWDMAHALRGDDNE